MINKNLVLKKFEKYIDTYEQNATVQKQMAEKLVAMLPHTIYDNILEIGSYSGVLTSKINQNIKYQKYSALDVVKKSEAYIKKIDKNINFINTDIENFETDEKFDLIISNASLQWCEDIESVIAKLKTFLNIDGTIAISMFIEGNLSEIASTFGVSLKYPDMDKIYKLFGENAIIISEMISLKFHSPLEVLKHLKCTGVNSLAKLPFPYKELKVNLERLNSEWQNTLTYLPVYVIV